MMKNVVYLITTKLLEKEGRYIIGKSTAILNHVSRIIIKQMNTLLFIPVSCSSVTEHECFRNSYT